MKLVRENIIFEKFKQESDPISDMNIGIKYKIDKLMKKLGDMHDRYYEEQMTFDGAYVGLEAIEEIEDYIMELFHDDEIR